MKEKSEQNNSFKNWMYFWIFISAFVIFYVIYNFYFQNDFKILVEESCDPTLDKCFYRDCEEEECPPNNLEYYSQYYTRASDFASCQNSPECNLSILCTNNQEICEKTECISGVDQCYISEIQ